MSHKGKGCLYVVSTPIGNLGDITYRSVEMLRQVSLIAAEDTRRTRILLNRYEIATSLSSYNSYNKIRKGPEFIKRLNQGEDVALVSDAGTPGVSDPLYHLVQLALAAEVEVISIPGPSAILSALTVSGLPMDRFRFEGFLPRKKRRKRILEELAGLSETVVLFESPQRIEKTLNELREVFGNRKAAITRELTKMHEEVLRGGLDDLCKASQGRKWKGEITLVLSGKSSKNKNKETKKAMEKEPQMNRRSFLNRVWRWLGVIALLEFISLIFPFLRSGNKKEQNKVEDLHTIGKAAVVEDGEIVARRMLYVALSYDHRIIDGRGAVQFLMTIKEILEDPARLMLGV